MHQAKQDGLIGNIAKEIYRTKSFYYNNYIDANVTVENDSTGSLIIGGRTDENEYITNSYVYKYSSLNGDYTYTTNDNIDDDQYLVRDDLNESMFKNTIGLGTAYWDYAPMQKEKYPKIKDNYLYSPELQEGIDLPTDPEIVDIGNGLNNKVDNNSIENSIATQSIEDLPEVKVYLVSVNEINIDFSSVPENTSFTYYINGNEIETKELTEKTYTFKYNFRDEMEIKLSNGQDEEKVTIKPEDVTSNISLVGNDNAYLFGTTLYINGEVQAGEYVNVYEGYALNSSGQVLDIEARQLTSETTKTSLEETEKPLHSYSYKDNEIEVYGTYSKVNNNVKLQIYNVRSGKLSALSNSIDMKINNNIVDNYNNKEYQTILTSVGEIIDLKEQLQYPNNFLSRNIKQIVQNNNQEYPEMMVMYNTGKVIVFNYVTGNVIYENDEQSDSGLANYITGSITNIWNDYEDKQAEYAKSRELIMKLEENPIDKVLDENNVTNTTNDSTNTNLNNSATTNTNEKTTESYITVYNGETGEYEVYSESEILEGKEEQPVSETTKIKENGLEGIYNYEVKEETGTKVNGALIVVVIIVIAIISLVILRKLVYKNNQKNNNK